jgi:anti-sigma B factor antagonist
MTADTTIWNVDSGLVLPVFGDIDAANADALHEQLLSLIESGRDFGIVDMSDVTFMDSTGLSALIAARKQLLRENCAMRLVITRPNLHRLFEVTGLTEVFDIFPSVEAAAA